MGIRVAVFRGQGVRVDSRCGVVHGWTSPTEVRIRFREGFEMVALDRLLPVVALGSVARRFEEHDLEIELSMREINRDDQLEPELSDEEPAPESSDEESEKAEMVEEIEE